MPFFLYYTRQKRFAVTLPVIGCTYVRHTVSRLAFALHIFFEEHVLIIEDGIGKLPYPVTEYHHAGLAAQHDVEFYVSMSVQEIVYFRMPLRGAA